MNLNSRPRPGGVSKRSRGAVVLAARGTLRERFRAETRDAILAAAERALGQHGARGAKMEVIAKAAGIAVGTLYNYFADRQELIDALLELRRSELIGRLDAVLDQSANEGFERRLEDFLGAALSHFREHREFIALLLNDELSSGHGSRWTMARALRARAERLIDSGIGAGLLRPDDRATYPHVLVGLLKGLIETAVESGEVEDVASTLIAPAVRCFLRGARVEAGSAA